MFQAPKLTNVGKAAYYDNMAGDQLKITTIQMGSGVLSGAIANMTALVAPVVTINAGAKVMDGYVDVSGAFTNADLQEGFYWREIGVFVANPDDPDNRAADILYCYQNAYDTADFIPVAAVEIVEKNITIPVVVGDTENVTCTLTKSLIFATLQDLENHDESLEAHKGTFVLKSEKAAANGVATLDADETIPAMQKAIKDDTDTSTKFILGVEAGKLYMQEV